MRLRPAVAVWVIGVLSPLAAVAAPAATVTVDRETLARQPERRLMLEGWRYRVGDDPGWADPALDERAWRVADRMLALPGERDVETGWFRLHLRVGKALRGQRMWLWAMHIGAIEVYLDGRRVAQGGSVEAVQRGAAPPVKLWNQRPLPLRFDKEHHVLALRLATRPSAARRAFGRDAQVMPLISADEGLREVEDLVMFANRINYGFIGAGGALAVLHLLLFFFYRERPENLYYSLTTGAVVAIAYTTLSMSRATSLTALSLITSAFATAVVLVSILGLRCYYAMFAVRVPRYFWGMVVAGFALLLGSRWLLPVWVVYVFALVAFVEQLRVLGVALWRRADGAWIVGVGGLLSIIASAVTMVADAQNLPGPWRFAYLYGFFALLDTMSIYLARSVARDRHALAAQLEENRRLSDLALEQQRDAAEQEAARQALEAERARQELQLREAERREVVLRQLEAANRELHETQAQLVQSEKLAALGQLVAGVAHELNTPLGAIRSTQDSLGRAVAKLKVALDRYEGAEGDRAVQRSLTAIEQADQLIADGGARVTEIVDRLRSFARLDEAELKRVDINRGIEDVLALLGSELGGDGVTITRELAELPPVACYPRQLNQALINLLANARQAVGEGGGEICVSSRRNGRWVEIEVRDNGVGIAQEHLDRIFDPGFTTRGVGVGTGLGLAICYRVIKQHGGEIDVDSTPGRGSRFTLRIPADRAVEGAEG